MEALDVAKLNLKNVSGGCASRAAVTLLPFPFWKRKVCKLVVVVGFFVATASHFVCKNNFSKLQL